MMQIVGTGFSPQGRNAPRKVYDFAPHRPRYIFDWRIFSFGFELARGNLVTVMPGYVHFERVEVYGPSALTEVTLTGSVEYVYVSLAWDAVAGTLPIVNRASTYPESTPKEMRWPLLYLEATSPGSYKIPDGGVRHIGDIHLGSVLA